MLKKRFRLKYDRSSKWLLSALIILFVSCNDDILKSSVDSTNIISSIEMSASHFLPSETTRTTLIPDSSGTKFSWKSGDIVAVYSNLKGMTNFFIEDESISGNGTSANFNGSGFKLEENKTYYAFYPYNGSSQYLDKTSIPVNYIGQEMKSNGDFSDLGNFDYMYAKGTTDKEGTTSLSFYHLGCVVEYKLQVPQTAYYTNVRFELENEDNNQYLISQGTVDITKEEPSIHSNEAQLDSILEVKLNKKTGIKVSKDSLLIVYMMMAPQNLLDRKINIRLVDSNQKWYTATVDGKNMRAGYTYHYEVSEKTGGFTGSGTNLPNDDLSLNLISTYTDNTQLGYEGMFFDENILYTSGQFGVRSIDYYEKKYPKLINSQTISNISNNRTDMLARSVAVKDDYLYVPLRQTSSGSNENNKPTIRFRFESNIGNYNNIQGSNGISSNSTVNKFFKILRLSSININQNFKVLYLYKGFYQDGYYLNTINLQGEDGTSSVLFRETFKTQEEALAALKTDYKNEKGDYCVVDWNALPKYGNVIRNVEFYTLGEFDSYQHEGTASISSSTESCPNTGIYGLCINSGNGISSNTALLTYNLSSTESEGYLSFWCKVEQTTSPNIEIPLTGFSGKKAMSFLLKAIDTEHYLIGLKSNSGNSFGTSKLTFGEWYNFKIKLSPTNNLLWWRTKEAGAWIKETSLLSANDNRFNQITTGINTNSNNIKIYFDDYYYNKLELDNVSYINGKLAILNKKTLNVHNIYNLDVKAIDAKVYENRLVVTCFYGFNVYDITDAGNPQLAYSYRVNNFKESQNCEIFKKDGKIYAFICNYSQGYTIADITDMNNITIAYINNYKDITYNGENLYGKIYNFDVCINYPYAYLTNATMRSYINTNKDRRGILTINLTDFNNPNPNFSFVPQNMITTVTGGDPRPTHITCYNNYLIINNTEKGILVFDNENPQNPIFTNSISIPGKPSINDFFASKEGYLFINDNNHGGATWSNRNVYLYKISE